MNKNKLQNSLSNQNISGWSLGAYVHKKNKIKEKTKKPKLNNFFKPNNKKTPILRKESTTLTDRGKHPPLKSNKHKSSDISKKLFQKNLSKETG